MKILGIIPARYASTRLPGKPLVDIGGRSMVMRVWDGALRSKMLSEVVVATDDLRVMDRVVADGGKAVMTAADHPSGTDRCYEAFRKLGSGFDAVVNVQGDEPFIDPRQIDQVCELLSDPTVAIATLAAVITNERDIDDPGEAKIIVDHAMNALYFSRAPIPHEHKPADKSRAKRYRYLKHVGLYAYRATELQRIVALGPSPLEQMESLEQLRWLEAGSRIRVGITDIEPFCVDTAADLEEARRRLKAES
jgi:3-deoxy-manno-octulosonate cytidylyltransferase (CMP-KDO synthetase)